MIYQNTAFALLLTIALNLYASDMTSQDLQVTCKDPTYDAGSFDYADPDEYIQNEIRNIEKHHFNEKVRSGVGGQTGYLIADLAFILRNVPNHYPALTSIASYYLAGRPSRGYAPADCYFIHAHNFRPNDGTVQLIYGIFLVKSDRVAEAERQYKLAIENLVEPAEAHYNLGLLYLGNNQNNRAFEHAKIAYKRGYPLPGLKNKLRDLGMNID